MMKQAIIGLHSSRASTSQVARTSSGVHGPESRLRTSAVCDTISTQAAHRPKPTIFVSERLLCTYDLREEDLLCTNKYSGTLDC